MQPPRRKGLISQSAQPPRIQPRCQHLRRYLMRSRPRPRILKRSRVSRNRHIQMLPNRIRHRKASRLQQFINQLPRRRHPRIHMVPGSIARVCPMVIHVDPLFDARQNFQTTLPHPLLSRRIQRHHQIRLNHSHRRPHLLRVRQKRQILRHRIFQQRNHRLAQGTQTQCQSHHRSNRIPIRTHMRDHHNALRTPQPLHQHLKAMFRRHHQADFVPSSSIPASASVSSSGKGSGNDSIKFNTRTPRSIE